MRMPALAIIGQLRAIAKVCPQEYWLPEELLAFADALSEAAASVEQALATTVHLPKKGDAA